MTSNPSPPLAPEAFRIMTGQTDQAIERLQALLELLLRWQPRINLVARSTLADPWRRHILDSAQLLPLIPEGEGPVADIGSGAGFPGLVLAILGVRPVHLVESDGRKCAFLREAARITKTDVVIHNARAENLHAFGPANERAQAPSLRPPAAPAGLARALVARALAPIGRILAVSRHLLAPGGVLLLLKGKTVDRELTEARENWNMTVTRLSSQSDPSGIVLKLEEINPI